jgi:tRNA dimethylallyltransferase
MYDAIVIIGPTAVGKSDVAVEVAERLGGEIISADSMQVYKGLDIGTAKPSADMLARVPHHMIDVASPEESYSVAEYRRAAGEVILNLQARGVTPVVVGGTGLYIHSLIFDMDFGGMHGSDESRADYERLAEERGREYVHDILAKKDPEAAKLIHPNNLTRVIRALERVSGGYAQFGFDLRKGGLLKSPALFCLARERSELVARIEKRVDEMVAGGLAKEAKRVLDMGLTPRRVASIGIGYKEMIAHLCGEYGLRDAVNQIKIRTRQYARRQITWFKRYDEARVIDLTGTDGSGAADEILRVETIK